MERNAKGEVKKVEGTITVEEWLEIYANPTKIRGSNMVTVTFGADTGK